MPGFSHIKRKTMDQPQPVFYNQRIQTSIHQHTSDDEDDELLGASSQPENNHHFRRTQRSPKQMTRPLRQSWLSPLLQMRIRKELQKQKGEGSPSTANDPPPTGHLLKRARKVHDDTLKYIFVKDWERAQQMHQYRKRKKPHLYSESCNPNNRVIYDRYPNHTITELDNLEYRVHLSGYAQNEDSQTILVKAMTETVGAQNPNKGYSEYRCPPQNELPMSTVETRYPKPTLLKAPEKILEPKPPQLSEDDLLSLERMRKHYTRIQKDKPVTQINTRSRAHEYVLEISNLDTSLKKYLINSKLGSSSGHRAKYLQRFGTEVSDRKQNLQTKSEVRQVTNLSPITKEDLASLIQSKTLSQHKQQPEPKRTNQQIKKVILSPKTTVRQRIKDVKNNPYIIVKPTFHFQKLNQRDWVNLSDTSCRLNDK